MNCPKANNGQVRGLLDKIGYKDVHFSISDGNVLLDRKIPKEDFTFIRHNTSNHIDSVGNIHHIDQIANMEVKSE